MTDLDDRISRVLHHHAVDTAIENNLDLIVSDGHIVRFTTAADRRRRRTPQLLVAAAACLLIVGGGIVITQLRSDGTNEPPAADQSDAPQTMPTRVDPSGRIFPVLDDVPEKFAQIYPTTVTFVAPNATSTTVGRLDGDRLTDVATISAAALDDTDGEEVLVPPDAQVADSMIGGRDVVVYDNAGGRWYRWIDGGVAVLVQASTDSDAIVAGLTTTLDIDTGVVEMDLGDLPAELSIIAAPQPLTGTHPVLSTDDGPDKPTLDLFPTDMSLMVQSGVVDSYTIVDIDGAVGYAVDSDDGAIVTWETDSGVWLRLSASSTDKEQLTEVARQVRLVDRESWNDRYDMAFEDETPTPTTMP